jgi:hypothetical protein
MENDVDIWVFMDRSRTSSCSSPRKDSGITPLKPEPCRQEQPPEAAHLADFRRQLGLRELVPGQVQEVQAGEVAKQSRVEHAGEPVAPLIEHLEAP